MHYAAFQFEMGLFRATHLQAQGHAMKILRIIPIAVIGITLLSAPAKARAGAELKDVVATLEEGYKKLEDVHARFSQRAAIASLKREELGGGELYIKRPAGGTAMFRFNYKKPQKQQIISNGKTVWIYAPDARQVMVADIRGVLEGGSGGTLNYLTGLGRVSNDFNITFAGNGQDKKGNYVLQLVPKKRSQVMARLQITVLAEAVEQYLAAGSAKEPFPVAASVLYDHYGNKTALEFSKARTNRGLSNSLFTFTPPAGVEVIRQGK